MGKMESPAAANGRALESVIAGERDDPEDNPTTKAKARRSYAAQRRWHAAHPMAGFAQTMARSAERRGLLVRPERCECCGSACRLDAHHEDYERPLMVRWLCRRCHRRLHAAERRAARGA